MVKTRRIVILGVIAAVVAGAGLAAAGRPAAEVSEATEAGHPDEVLVLRRLAAEVQAAGGVTAFGASSVAVRDAWAATLRCQYAHGAFKRPLGAGGFEVVGLTPEVREACRSAEAKAEAAMASPGYVAEQFALGRLLRDVYACVERRGFMLGSDDSGGHKSADPARQAAFVSCKRSTFAAASVSELTPLP